MAALRFWLAIVMLLDAAVGLWWSNRWQSLAPRVNVVRMAVIEGFVAMAILWIHFFVDPR